MRRPGGLSRQPTRPRARGPTPRTIPASTAARPTTPTPLRRTATATSRSSSGRSASAPTRRRRRRAWRPSTTTARQLDQQGRDANVDAGDPQCSQISGVRADTAWKYSSGLPTVSVAILDTGIRWQNTELVDKVRLNQGELPLPQHANGDELRQLQLQRRRRLQRRGLRRRPARVGERRRRHLGHRVERRRDPRRLRPDRHLLAGNRRRRQRLRRRHRRLGLLRQRQRPLRRLELLQRRRPRDRARPGGAGQDQQRGRRDGAVPEVPADAAADLGLVRSAHRQLGARRHLRRRQRRERGGGRDRRADQHAVRAQRRALRGQQGHGADARLERHQQRQPQLPHQLQRGRLRRRLVPRHRAQQHLHRARRPAGDRGRASRPAGGIRGGLPAAPGELGRHRRHPDRAAVHHELLPQLQPDPVRRQGRHRPDGHDGLREHRPGGGGRGPLGVVRSQHLRRQPGSRPGCAATRPASS